MWIFWKVFIGNDDSEVEGVWANWYTDEVSEAKANKKINKTDPVSQANNSCCQQFPSLWSTNHGLQTAHMMEARNTTACTSRSLLLISVCSQMLQVNMEDSGRTLATPSNPTINDEKCARGYCSICEVAAPVRRVTVRGLCQLSIFDRSIDKSMWNSFYLHLQITPVRSPGSTITSSMMTGSQCLSAATPLFSSTTDPSAPGCGTPNTRSTQYHMSCGGNTQ